MKKSLFTLLSLSLLTSCSGNYSTSTNLDAQNFTNYFAPSHVKIYSSVAEFNGQHKYLGVVEGEDCQTKAHYAKPDEVIARTDARKKAYELKANAIIFSGCTLLTGGSTAKQCVTSTVCYGQAYYLDNNSTKK